RASGRPCTPAASAPRGSRAGARPCCRTRAPPPRRAGSRTPRRIGPHRAWRPPSACPGRPAGRPPSRPATAGASCETARPRPSAVKPDRRKLAMAPRKDAVSKKTVAKIEKLAENVLKTVQGGKSPFLDIPVRSLANVSFSEKKRLIELGSQKQKRYFFNVSMAKRFMQTFLVSEACKELIDAGK